MRPAKTFIPILLLAASHSASALAQEWVALNGAEITAALTDRSVKYGDATQRFYASGRTLYNAGQDSWGYWRVEGDKYCSQWPPGERWDCYRLEKTSDGTQIRFLDPENRPFVGIYTQ
jgi:hypothetical protein